MKVNCAWLMHYVSGFDEASLTSKLQDSILEGNRLDDDAWQLTIPHNRPDLKSVIAIAQYLAGTQVFSDEDFLIESPITEVKFEDKLFTYMILDTLAIPGDLDSYYAQHLGISGLKPKNYYLDVANLVNLTYGSHIFMGLVQQEDLIRISPAAVQLNNNHIDWMESEPVKVTIESAPTDETTKLLVLVSNRSPELNPAYNKAALGLACKLLAKKAWSEPHRQMLQTKPIFTKTISVNCDNYRKLLGFAVGEDTISALADYNHWHYDKVNQLLTVPTFRKDLQEECDLAEEVLFFIGPRFPVEHHTYLELNTSSKPRNLMLLQYFAIRGYHEMKSFAFVPKAMNDYFLQHNFLLHRPTKTLKPMNPMSEDLAELKVSVLAGPLTAFYYNLNRQHNNIHLIELATCFMDDDIEQQRLAGISYGSRQNHSIYDDVQGKEWRSPLSPVLADLIPILPDDTQLSTHNDLPNSLVFTLNDQVIGHVGVLPGISKTVVGFEIIIKHLYSDTSPKFQEFSKYPAVKRDLSIKVPKEVTFSVITSNLAKVPYLEKVTLKDLHFSDDELEFKVVTLGLAFSSLTSSITDEQANLYTSILESVVMSNVKQKTASK